MCGCFAWRQIRIGWRFCVRFLFVRIQRFISNISSVYYICVEGKALQFLITNRWSEPYILLHKQAIWFITSWPDKTICEKWKYENYKISPIHNSSIHNIFTLTQFLSWHLRPLSADKPSTSSHLYHILQIYQVIHVVEMFHNINEIAFLTHTYEQPRSNENYRETIYRTQFMF